jgi:phage shock protein PspC (stress-responsive transcriptional regulator)
LGTKIFANGVQVMQAQQNQVALPLRSHTILGVCEAVGEDFGFNPVFLRVPLAAVVLYSMPLAAALYVGLGLIVLASRLLFPRQVQEQMKTPVATPAEAAEELPEFAKAA